MKILPILLLLAGLSQVGLLQAQPPTVIPPGSPLASAPVNANFLGLYEGRIGRWTGAGAPGDLPFSLIGDIYFNTSSTGTIYGCYRVHCTGVGANNWVLISGGGGGGGGASVALDNLSGVFINTSLLAQVGSDLGSFTAPFRNIVLYGVGTYGTNYTQIVSHPTSTRTLTLPDATDVLVGTSTADVFLNKQISGDQITSPPAVAIGSTITNATAGSILFAGASAVFGQDNANFNWDPVNHCLNIGLTATGCTAVSIMGASILINKPYAAMGLVSTGTGNNAEFYLHGAGAPTTWVFGAQSGGGFTFYDVTNAKNALAFDQNVPNDLLWGHTNGAVTIGSNLGDTGVARNAAGILEVNNGTPGTFADLKVQNMTIAGTCTGCGAAIGSTITGGTSGSILFVNPTGVFAQDNTNLTFNTSDKIVRTGGGFITNAATAVQSVVGWAHNGILDFSLFGETDGSILKLGYYDVVGTFVAAPFQITKATGAVNFNLLNGSGTNFACLDLNGQLTRSSTLCASSTAGGDLTGTYPNPALATVNSNTGACGDSTHVSQVTLDAKGRATACTAVLISGSSPPPAGTPLFTSTASTTVANTTSETSIIGTGVGSLTIPANYFAIGTSLEIWASGYFSSAVADTLNIKIKAGSTILGATGAITPTSQTNAVFRLHSIITARTIGASGTLIVNTILETTGAALAPNDAKILNTSAVTVDTTATQAMGVTATWGTMSASDTITGTNFMMLSPGGTLLTGDVTSDASGVTTIANSAVTNAKIANATIDLTAKVVNALPVANGGTGLATLTNHALYVGNTTSAPTALAVGATDKPLVGSTAANPLFSKLTLTNPATAAVFTLADNKTFTVNNTITLAGTDAQTYTFPTTSATIARTDAANTFTGVQTMTSPVFTTPNAGTPSALVCTNCTGTATGLTAGITNALKSATTTVDVSAATAPSANQVLTAVDSTHATWQAPGAGSGTVTHTGNLTALSMMIGNAVADSKVSNIVVDAGLNNLTLPAGGVLTAPGGILSGGATSACDGTAGCFQFGQGTAPSGLGTTAVQLIAGTGVTSWRGILPTAIGATGFLRAAVSGTTATFSNSAIIAADLPATPLIAPGTGPTLVGPRGYAVCTGTCTVSVPVPVAGYEFCIVNDDNVATAITLSALGSSAMYENSARTAYGTAGTGTLVVAAAAKNKVCLLGRDSTHYFTISNEGGAITVN